MGRRARGSITVALSLLVGLALTLVAPIARSQPKAPPSAAPSSAPNKVVLKAPGAADKAKKQEIEVCRQAATLDALYSARITAVAALKAKRTDKTPSAPLIDDAKSDVDAVNKQIDEAKATFDALGNARGEPPCDEACVKAKAVKCKTSGPAKALGGGAAGSAAAAGLSWQTTLITGLSQFLSDRAQQEVVLWLVTQVQTEICSNQDAKSLFRETCNLLDPAQGYADMPAGTVLAAAIRADLEGLPAEALIRYVHLSKPTAKAIVQVFLDMRRGHPPLELIAGWSVDVALTSACQAGDDRLACGMMIVSSLVANAGDVATGDLTAVNDATAALVIKSTNLNLQVLFPGLKEGAAAADLAKAEAAGGKLLDQVGDLERVKGLLRAVAELARTIDRAGKFSGSGADRAIEMLNGTRLVLDAGAVFLPDLPLSSAQPQTVKVFWVTIDDGIDATTAILTGQYSEGIHKIVSIVRAVAVDRDHASLPAPVARYLGLIVDLSNAKTAGDMQAALQSAAAPVGSWRDKRKAFSISVTGLVGGAGGYELPLSPGSGARKGSGSLGVMGAVGFDLAFPCGDTSTWGVFVSVLDVGQLISTPVSPPTGAPAADKSTSTAKAGTDFQLVQVFSPGAYFRVGAGKSPFTFGVGGAVAPQLRLYETKDAAGNLSKDLFSMVRFNAFLAVDITMFPIYRKAR